MFKSYYVVWKLLNGPGKYFEARGFKSYYVVWKLADIAFKLSALLGLNRTM